MRLFEFDARRNTTLLMEMNVANSQELTTAINGAIDEMLKQRQATMQPAIRDALVKRFMKAMVNDDHGEMVTATPVEALPDNAPEWMQKAVEAGQKVFTLELKKEWLEAMPHIVDWLVDDPNPTNALRAAPAKGLLKALYKASDDYFAAKSAANASKNPSIEDEPGREVVMTFRAKDGGQWHPFHESTLAPNENGAVFAFWCKLLSKEALNREGELMGHCVGSYYQVVKEDRATIYSLRDAKNQPAVTVEVQHGSGGQIVLNQLKGKQNQPPVGKYAPFIKAFLNTLNVKANSSGAKDIRGVGLFTNDGKYGDLNEIGATVVTTFENGDTIRFFKDPQEEGRYGYWGGSRSLNLYYVEKSGTLPFAMSVNYQIQDRNNPPPEEQILRDLKGKSVNLGQQYRKESNRFSTYVKNLKTFFNKEEMTGERSFENMGLYFNRANNKWGSLSEAGVKVFSEGSVTAYGMMYREWEVVFVNEQSVPLFTAKFTRYGAPEEPNNYVLEEDGIKMHVDTDVPRYLMNFLNSKTVPYEDWPKKSKDLVRGYGIIYNAHRSKFVSAYDSKKTVIQNKEGAIKTVGVRIYFFDPKGRVLASTMSQTQTIDWGDLRWFTEDKVNVLNLVYDLRKALPNEWSIRNFRNRTVVENGYVAQGSDLIKVSDLTSREIRLPGGQSVDIEIGAGYSGSPNTTYKVNTDLGMLSIIADSDRDLNEVTGEDAVKEKYLADLLNVTETKVDFVSLFGYKLEANDTGTKYLPLRKNTPLYAYLVSNKLSLGGNLSFERNGRYSSDYACIPNGYIKFNDGERDHRVASIEASIGSDPSIKIVRNLPDEIKDKVSRDDVYDAVTKFMRFYHKELEFYDRRGKVDPKPKPKANEARRLSRKRV